MLDCGSSQGHYNGRRDFEVLGGVGDALSVVTFPIDVLDEKPEEYVKSS